jgi:Mrp family chromosome partitioning ATPase
MTNLDQAFIKAYQQQTGGASQDERIPLSEALELAKPEVSTLAENTSWLRKQAAAESVPPPHADFSSSIAEKLLDSGQPETVPFRPLLEVDEFVLPAMCRELYLAASYELDMLADALAYESSHGLGVLAIDGCTVGEGTTTLVLCLADRISKLDVKVAVVDANFSDPQVGTRLGLFPEAGWENVLREELPLDEVVIEACLSPMAVLPRCKPSSIEDMAEEAARMAADIETLRSSFDLVLVDMPPLENQAMIDGLLQGRFAKQLDAILFTQNVRHTSDDRLAALQSRLQFTSVKQSGIVQTFVPAA